MSVTLTFVRGGDPLAKNVNSSTELRSKDPCASETQLNANGTVSPMPLPLTVNAPVYGPSTRSAAGVSTSVTMFDSPGLSDGSGFVDATLIQDTAGTLMVSGPDAAPPRFITENWRIVCAPRSIAAASCVGAVESCATSGVTVTFTGRSRVTPSAVARCTVKELCRTLELMADMTMLSITVP